MNDFININNDNFRVLIISVVPLVAAGTLFGLIKLLNLHGPGAVVEGPVKGLNIRLTGPVATYFIAFYALLNYFPAATPPPSPSPSSEEWEVIGRLVWAPMNQSVPRVVIRIQPPLGSQSIDEHSFSVRFPVTVTPAGIRYPSLAFEAKEIITTQEGRPIEQTWTAEDVSLDDLIRNKHAEVNALGKFIKLNEPVTIQLRAQTPFDPHRESLQPTP